jgi:hypothetical protein
MSYRFAARYQNAMRRCIGIVPHAYLPTRSMFHWTALPSVNGKEGRKNLKFKLITLPYGAKAFLYNATKRSSYTETFIG